MLNKLTITIEDSLSTLTKQTGRKLNSYTTYASKSHYNRALR